MQGVKVFPMTLGRLFQLLQILPLYPCHQDHNSSCTLNCIQAAPPTSLPTYVSVSYTNPIEIIIVTYVCTHVILSESNHVKQNAE